MAMILEQTSPGYGIEAKRMNSMSLLQRLYPSSNLADGRGEFHAPARQRAADLKQADKVSVLPAQQAGPARRIRTSMAGSRTIAFAILMLTDALVYQWVSAITGGMLTGLMAVSIITVPILILMRCFLDRCEPGRR